MHITNEEYQKNIIKLIESINLCEQQSLEITKKLLTKNMYLDDIAFIGLLDRSINLARGFISMVENRNLTCCGAILRLIIDNCLRAYAICIAKDRENLIKAVIQGEKLCKFKDVDGKEMTDTYLHKQLAKFDQSISKVYKETSGFIHFSNKAVFQSIYSCKDDGHLEFQVGRILPEKFNDNIIECTVAYEHYYKIFLSIMSDIADSKRQFDNTNINETQIQ